VARTDAVLDGIGALGRVRSREVKARDVGKEYHDATILLESLRATLRRYQEILAKANDVKDMLQIEGELNRIRQQIEQVEGNLRWMQDRTARATIHVDLQPIPSTVVEVPPQVEPNAKFYPGLRATHMVDLRGERGNDSLAGGGLSLQFSRGFSCDVDFMDKLGDGRGNVDAFLVTLGGDIYSDLLGGGHRRTFNPYLGLRIGYGRVQGSDDVVLGGVIGLEIVKTKRFILDAQFRGLGMFGKNESPHVGLQSSIGANVAF
jgi:hypothetical protein